MRTFDRSFLLIVLVSLTAFAAPPHPSTRDDALRLYRAGKYDQACPLFEKLAQTAKTDGSLWADYSLCEWKRGGSSWNMEWSAHKAFRFGDERTRKNALFNLHQAERRAQLPPLNAPQPMVVCAYGSTDSDCPNAPPIWMCVVPWNHQGSGGGESGTRIAFGADTDELVSVMRGDEVPDSSVDLEFTDEAFCGWCEAHAWDCASSRVVQPEFDKCVARSKGVDGGDFACLQTVCDKAQRAYEEDRSIWPAAADEIKKAHEQCRNCGVQEERECEILVVDTCQRRVGYYCTSKTGHGKGEAKELSLDEAKSE